MRFQRIVRQGCPRPFVSKGQEFWEKKYWVLYCSRKSFEFWEFGIAIRRNFEMLSINHSVNSGWFSQLLLLIAPNLSPTESNVCDVTNCLNTHLGCWAVGVLQVLDPGLRAHWIQGASGCCCCGCCAVCALWSQGRVPPDAAGICLLPKQCTVQQILAVWGPCLHVLFGIHSLAYCRCSLPKNKVQKTISTATNQTTRCFTKSDKHSDGQFLFVLASLGGSGGNNEPTT